MALPASSHTKTNAASDHALPPPSPQHETLWIPETTSSPANMVVQPSAMMKETNVSSLPDSSKEKKKKKKAEDQKIILAPPKFLVADMVAPLNEKGFLKAPEPSIETSELWSSQVYGDEVWAHALIPQKLRVGAPGEGIHEMRYKMNLYSPQVLLCRIRPRIAGRLPDPVKGPLSRHYISNPLSPHLCRVTSTPYEWFREIDHLISGYTRIKGYPPGTTPVIIIGTTSDPQKLVEQWQSDEQKAPKKNKGKTNTGRGKSSSTTTLTSRKRNVIEVTSGATEGPTKIACTTQTQRKKNPSSRYTVLTIDGLINNQASQEHRLPPPKSNIETARAILSNPAKIHRSLSLGLATMSSSQASTDSTKTNPVLISSSCPVTTSTAAVTSFSSAVPERELTITFPIWETDIEGEGLVMVPTPETDGLAFADDQFNLDSILSEAQEEETSIQTQAKQDVVNHDAIIGKHASSVVSSLENFMEGLFNSHTLLESSLENLYMATAELSKHKKEVAKYGKALSKIKPLMEMGTTKEKEADSTEQTQLLCVEQLEKELLIAKQTLADTRAGLAKIKATNFNLKNKMAEFE
ncbi:hypothetical protein PIB30_060007 [Stylosanthes scabra]|uniref:Uncharacterized protein n=1 Tax=Stylosanthes scabra TaxID=79078 RepID=A0ABU6VIU2_9FABA|nr:hypothetical protein [Stylosanthes scabra]